MSESTATPLWGRLLLVGLAGAIAVAAVSALLTVPLLRSVSREQARAELARAVETLAARPRAVAILLVRERRAVGADDRSFALLETRGPSVGQVSLSLTGAQKRTLARTGAVSATEQVDGRESLVEARTSRRGMTAIGVQPVDAIDAEARVLVRRILLALAAGLLLAVAVSVLVARRIAAPVHAAADAARRLAAGERGIALPSSPIVEIDDMGQALQSLDHALATSEGRQREFLLSISHELRTPLTAIRGYAEALRDGAVPPTEASMVGGVLVTETERLDDFIADLLALARLEADDFRVDPAPTDLAELLSQTATVWLARARAVGVACTADGSRVRDRRPVLDPMRVRQLLDGLVENALRATPAGGTVHLTASYDEGGHPPLVTLEVSDTGPGLAPGEHEHAFERGRLRERYADERPVGTGLGLSIAHRLAGRLGGTIEARPGSPSGTVFAVRLPLVAR